MKQFPQIAARVLNTPLLLEPAYARVFFSAMASRLGINSLADAEGRILVGQLLRASADSYTRTCTNKYGEEEEVYQVRRGVAIIPVQGTLVHRFGHLNPYSGMTGYDGILQRVSAALADTDVQAVLLDLNTPGGEVAGCFDTARTLRSLADAVGKQLWALCCDMNCSAGMALASAAHRRLITQTGRAGSVGVVMAHANHAQQLEDQGVDVTLIHSGARKVDGNPYGALPPDVLERFQAETDTLRTEFAQLVSDHMGLSLEAVLATEAAVFRGQSAIEVGLADELVNGHEAIGIFSEHLSLQGKTTTLGTTMSTTDTTPQATTPATSPAAGAEQPAPVAAAPTPAPAADAVITPEAAAAAAMARVQGIMGLEGAADYSATTNYMAFSTGLTVEQAKGLMATLPAPSTTERMGAALDSVMANEQQPDVGADAGDQSAGNQLLADYEHVTGDK